MSHQPKVGFPADDEELPSVATLCKTANIHPTTYYREMRHGRAPRPRKGVPRSEALAWLDNRAADANARAEAAKAAAAALRSEEGAQK